MERVIEWRGEGVREDHACGGEEELEELDVYHIPS